MLTYFAILVHSKYASKRETDAACPPFSLSKGQLSVTVIAILVTILGWFLSPVLTEWYKRRGRNGLGDDDEGDHQAIPTPLQQEFQGNDDVMQRDAVLSPQQEGRQQNATEITAPPEAHLSPQRCVRCLSIPSIAESYAS
jgi:hypothetical protein